MNRGDRWQVELLPSARTELLALRNPTQERIRAAIRALADDPTPDNSIPMRGKGIGLYRLRIGMYRIVYRLQSQRLTVIVIRIGHRAEVYRGWEDR